MRKKIKIKKISPSITLNPKTIEWIDNNLSNRSKFIEDLIIDELCKDTEIKEELKRLKILV